MSSAELSGLGAEKHTGEEGVKYEERDIVGFHLFMRLEQTIRNL